MSQRDYMVNYRKAINVELPIMAKACRVSTTLLKMLEECDAEVTHPNIAKRIGKKYKLTNLQIEALMPINYRKHGPAYNPDKYKLSEDFVSWP